MNISNKFVFLLIYLSALLCAGRDIYVSWQGTNNYPYTNWPDAATNIEWAVNAAAGGDTVWITNGTYVLTNMVTVNNNITICGTGGRPVVDGNNSTRCFYIPAAVVTLSNLFITRGTNNDSGGGVWLKYGAALDCVLSNNTCGENYGGGMYIPPSGNVTVRRCTFIDNKSPVRVGGGLMMRDYSTGLIDHCLFQSNSAAVGGGGFCSYSVNSTLITGCDFIGNVGPGYGAAYLRLGGVPSSGSNIFTHCTVVSNMNIGLWIQDNGGWLVSNCYVSNNLSTSAGAGIIIEGEVTVKNCIIARNTLSGGVSINGGGVYIGNYAGALVQDCIIEENQSGYGGGGVDVKGGMMRNCLIRNNVASNRGGGLIMEGGMPVVSSCTIVSNYVPTSLGGGIFDNLTNNGNFENCIIYSNAPNDFFFGVSASTTYTNCCASSFAGALGATTNNITADPRFIAVASGNYRLDRSSPCVNSGVNRDWMTDAVDLDGHHRIDMFSGVVDIGCYEYIPGGTMYGFK